jgi:hypothetical protein
MTYSLRRTRDGAGDSGGMSLATIPTFDQDTGKIVDIEYIHEARPQIGASMRVGSLSARSYAPQDWWETTLVTEILEERTEEDGVEYVRFKTGNSEYEWRAF